MIEAENVLDYTKSLQKELSSGITVEYLHGKMKAKEKNAITLSTSAYYNRKSIIKLIRHHHKRL